MKDWPYPKWIAHRGAGKLAPENTLAAFRLGASYGYRMFECDVKLSKDGVPFLLHDTTLERTTNGKGIAGELTWSELSRLDAGSWHSRTYAGEPLATLDSVAQFCIQNGYFLNVEIKPTPGLDAKTGAVVVEHVTRLWADQKIRPLITSFSQESLRAAQIAESTISRGLLLEHLDETFVRSAQELDCKIVIANYSEWDAMKIHEATEASILCGSYTVNDQWIAQMLLSLNTHGIITDRIDQCSPTGD